MKALLALARLLLPAAFRRDAPEPPIPEFTPMTATAKVARRLSSSNLTWEI